MGKEYEYHELANIFPMMKGDEFVAFCEDIAENGLSEPIVLYKGKILDGRNRYEACRQKEVKLEFEQFKGDDAAALQFVISKNLHRRHLSPSQYSVIGAEIREKISETTENKRNSRLKEGGSPFSQHCENGNEAHSSVLASQAIGGAASPRSIEKASKVLESGSAQLVEAVKSGEVTVSDAEKIIDLPKSEQNEALKAVESGEARTLLQAVKEANGHFDKDILDRVKGIVPKSLHAVFLAGKELAQLAKEITTKAGEFKDMVDGTKEECPAGQYFLRTHQEIVRTLKECAANIRTGLPYAVCPYCKGKGGSCKRCSGSCGYVNEATYRGIPAEAKK